jgi:hypothetical protein
LVSDQGDLTARPVGDQPIDDAGQDELGREVFVLGLREEIRDSPVEGFVIGVTGDWGAGKTSVVNMAVGPLAEDPGYRVVRFNPWLFSGAPQLVEHFFAEISSQLREAGRRGKGERLDRLSDAINSYADTLDPLRFAPGVDAAVRAGKASAGALKKLSRQPQSAHDKKERLDALLAEHDQRLVIVIDDIDRLVDDEIRDVMRLVRLVGDFPNTVYVLAYAPAIVSKALGGQEGYAVGQAYLEKIVQVTHPVPAIDPDRLSKLLFARLDAALDGVQVELDADHWSAVYSAIRPYFRTLRDVVRYANATRSPVRQLISELDPADILGLEALRMFESAVWTRIEGLAEALTNPSGSYFIDRDREKADELIRAARDRAEHHDRVSDLLLALFPISGRALGGSNYGSDWMASWRRRGRVAHIENLRVYLARQVSSSGASRTLVEQIVAAMPDPAEARDILAGVEDDRLEAVLNRLADYEEQLPLAAAASIPVLYELRGRLPDRGPRFFDVEPEIHIGRVVYRIVKGATPAQVGDMLAATLSHLALLSDRFSVLRTMGWRSERADQLADPSQMDRYGGDILDDALSRSAEQLAAEPDLAALIYLMQDLRGQDSTSDWVRSRMSDETFALAVISENRREIRGSSGRHLHIRWDLLVELIGEKALIELVRALPDPDSWNRPLTADEAEMLKHARECAADPEAARQRMEELRSQYS